MHIKAHLVPPVREDGHWPISRGPSGEKHGPRVRRYMRITRPAPHAIIGAGICVLHPCSV